VALAATLGAALVGITHHSKGTAGRDPVERVTGSIAFGALARLAFAAAKLPEDEGGGRVIVRSKSNIGPDSGGFRYDLCDMPVPGVAGLTASAALWGEAIVGEAREILAMAESPQAEPRGGALAEAEAFLSGLLKGGPMPQRDIAKRADENGHAWGTVQRAKTSLGIESSRRGFGRNAVWWWTFPEGHFHHTCSEKSIGVHKNECAPMGKPEHLCDIPETEQADRQTTVDVTPGGGPTDESGDDEVIEEGFL